MNTGKDIINLDAGPSRRHENFRREGHLVAIGVRERESVSVSLTSMVTRCPSRRKFSCRLLGTYNIFDTGIRSIHIYVGLFMVVHIGLCMNESRSTHSVRFFALVKGEAYLNRHNYKVYDFHKHNVVPRCARIVLPTVLYFIMFMFRRFSD